MSFPKSPSVSPPSFSSSSGCRPLPVPLHPFFFPSRVHAHVAHTSRGFIQRCMRLIQWRHGRALHDAGPVKLAMYNVRVAVLYCHVVTVNVGYALFYVNMAILQRDEIIQFVLMRVMSCDQRNSSSGRVKCFPFVIVK